MHPTSYQEIAIAQSSALALNHSKHVRLRLRNSSNFGKTMEIHKAYPLMRWLLDDGRDSLGKVLGRDL